MESQHIDERTEMLIDFLKPKIVREKSRRSAGLVVDDGATWRSTAAQWAATIANSMVFLGVGIMVAIPTVVIGVLHNSKGELSLNDEQSSWFGSLMLLVQPFGCLVASCLQQFIGRKYGMILMNIPQLIALFLLYTATAVETLYISVIMMGISAGFMEAPGLAYIGEIAQPRMRGMLTSYANINISFGMVFEFFLGSIFPWRTTIALTAVIPITAIILIAFVPDSPVWLLSKGRKEDALESLKWLRGWVSENEVKVEFEELCRYTEASQFSRVNDLNNKIFVSSSDHENAAANTRENGFLQKVRLFTIQTKIKICDMFRPAMRRPFFLVIGYMFFFHCAALSGIRCYLVEIFDTLKMPVDSRWLVFLTSLFMIVGGIICISSVKFVGKRFLSLVSLTICSVGCLILGAYMQYQEEINLPWIPMITICVLYFSTMLGISPIPWMLISEVFPIRGRAFGAGFSAACFYTIAFIFSKSYLDLAALVTPPVCILAYGIGGLIGCVFLYINLPETEGKTLADVEKYFTYGKQTTSDKCTDIRNGDVP